MSSVALVNMPWSSVRRGAIALGALKSVLREEGVASDVLYLNIRMASRMWKAGALVDYEALSEAHLLGEWLFSQHLFGKYGSSELANSYHDLLSGGWRDIEQAPGLSALLEQKDFDFETIAGQMIPDFIDECLELVDWRNYAVVGFSSVFNQNVPSLLLSKRIKELYPDIKIVFGGSNVHSVMGTAALKAFDWIDYVVDGEGEPVFPSLVKNLLDGKPYEELPGVSFRRGNEVILYKNIPAMYHLDSAPAPDYSEYFAELDRSGLGHVDKLMLFESSRGCWWGEKAHCTFCGLNGQYMKFRAKSADKVLKEIVDQAARHKTRFFYSVDNILDRQAFKDLLPALADHQLDLELFYEVKSNLNKGEVDQLRGAGVKYIQPGIESLDTGILKLMKKGVTAIQNIQLLKFCRSAGIHVNWNILYGFPGESREQYESMRETISLITHLQPPVGVTRIILQRFSPYHFDAERLGIRNIRPMAMYRHIYPDRVGLDDIAYYFDYSLEQGVEDPESYIGPIKEIYSSWKRAYAAGEARLQYRRGPGFIEINDSRPNWQPGQSTPVSGPRTIILDGIESEVYLFCESIRAFTDVVAMVGALAGRDQAEPRAREILHKFHEERLIFEEKEKYLSLAVPVRRTRPKIESSQREEPK